MQKKKFEILTDGTADRKFVYYVVSKEWGQVLLDLCKSTHRFQLSLQPILAEMRNLEARDQRYREIYVYSENAEFAALERRRSERSGGSMAHDERLASRDASIRLSHPIGRSTPGNHAPRGAPGIGSIGG